jgi:hypothetical protein
MVRTVSRLERCATIAFPTVQAPLDGLCTPASTEKIDPILFAGKPVVANNIVPSAAIRARDSPDYINNPGLRYFLYSGFTRPLSAAFPVQVCAR